MGDEGRHRGREAQANDNDPPDGDASNENDVAARLDAVVMSIARLIGRGMAREHFEALQAANDNTPPASNGTARDTDDKD